MNEPALFGAAAGVIAAGLAFATFWFTLGGRITKGESDAANALQIVAEVENDHKSLMERITLLQADFGLYRERAIEKFVTHQAISEIEKRLVESGARTEQRLSDAIEGMNKRLDRLVEAALAART